MKRWWRSWRLGNTANVAETLEIILLIVRAVLFVSSWLFFPKFFFFCCSLDIHSSINHFGRETSPPWSSHGSITKLSLALFLMSEKASFEHFLTEMIERIINLFACSVISLAFLHSPYLPCEHEIHYTSQSILIIRWKSSEKIQNIFKASVNFLLAVRYQTRSFSFFRLIEASVLREMFEQSPINVHDWNAQVEKASTLFRLKEIDEKIPRRGEAFICWLPQFSIEFACRLALIYVLIYFPPQKEGLFLRKSSQNL